MARSRSRGRRIAAELVWVLFCIALLELGARSFWWIRFGVSPLDAGRLLYAWYPELKEVDEARPGRDDGVFDVLLLGGSVMAPDWGDVPPAIEQVLAAQGVGNVRIWNLARPAHTTRDSLLKYAALEGARFELVIVYHGVNEARANNAPPDVFREDYGHYSWYELTNAMAGLHGESRFALPATARYVGLLARQALHGDRYVPTHEPRPEWLDWGGELRTPEAVRANLSQLIRIARERGDPLTLASFALYVPPDYSLEAFRAGRLDYAVHRTPLENWGRPAAVQAAVEAHNRVIRELARQAPDVGFADVARAIPHSGRFFQDPCHLTARGSLRFARVVLHPDRPPRGPRGPDGTD